LGYRAKRLHRYCRLSLIFITVIFYFFNLYTQAFHSNSIIDKTFLVTGGAGFIGSNIVEYLLQHGAGKVRVLDNLSTGKKENIAPFLQHSSFEFVQGDIRDADICRAAVHNMQYVSHQAALGSVPRSLKDPLTTNEVNVNGHLNMLVAARDANVARLVYAASSSTYGDSKELPKVEDRIGKPLSPYAVTKFVNELYGDVFSRAYGFHTIGLRYFNVFGPRQDPFGAYAAVIPLFFKAALDGKAPIINGDGEQSRDFTFVANAVQANIKAMLETPHLQQHEVCNIAFGENATLNELWENIRKISDRPSLNAHYGPDRAGDVRHSLANIEKAGTLFNYHPVYNLQQGLKIAHEWYLATVAN
jgi:UDP-N-acetylglucosamine 4-epimerase